MPRLRIRHESYYSYPYPVTFGCWRLLMRPLDTHATRLIAARFATGYLYSSGQRVRGAGATHAWCEVFLPGIGWTEFDPTNALVESASLIRVATTRTWRESDPMNGAVVGDVVGRLQVSVDVDLVDPAPLETVLAA